MIPDHRKWIFGCIFISLWILSEYFSWFTRKNVLMIVVSSFYAFRASWNPLWCEDPPSWNPLWCGEPPYVPSDHQKPLHFTLNSKWFYVKFRVIISIWFPAKKYSDGSCSGYWCFPNNFRWSVMWRLTVCAIRIHFISLWILCDSMWNSEWRYLCEMVFSW